MNQFKKDAIEAYQALLKHWYARGFTLDDAKGTLWYAVMDAFVDEFLYCRGWRQLPGSTEWV